MFSAASSDGKGSIMTYRFILLVAITLACVHHATRAEEPNPVEQRRQQQQTQAAVAQASRHAVTVIRVLAFQNVEDTEKDALLREVADTLRSLSEKDMNEVLKHLDSAMTVPDPNTATAAQQAAYIKHREILATLQKMIAKIDSLKSIDDAARRLSELAENQHRLYLDTTADKELKQQNREGELDNRDKIRDNQGDLKSELNSLLHQLAVLSPKLSPEHKDRMEKAKTFDNIGRLISQMDRSQQDVGNGNFAGASNTQKQTAEELLELASKLAMPRDRLRQLQEARNDLEKSIQEQNALKEEAKDEAKPNPERDRLGNEKWKADKEAAHQLAAKQSLLEFQTRKTRKMLDTVEPELARKLEPAERDMDHSENQLRNRQFDQAEKNQDKATKTLEETRDTLDSMIAKEQQAKTDPLAATQKAAEEVAKLIEDQKQTKKLTEQRKLDEAKGKQEKLAQQTNELKDRPLPDAPEAKEALKQAANMAKASDDSLHHHDPDKAVTNQQETINALEKAKAALDDKAKAIEQRRDEIAKLDEAANKLKELAKKEGDIAEGAKENADSKELAKQQNELTPPTKEVGDSIKESAPKAAEQVAEANKAQEQAKNALEQNQPEDGAKQADDAAKKLNEAADAAQQASEQRQAEEIADQAAMQPNNVDPAEAAHQVAKAIEKANEAAAEAQKAADKLGQPEPQPGQPAGQSARQC